MGSYAQSIWEPVSIPDSLIVIDINAEKEGIMLISAKSWNDHTGLYRSYDDGQSWQYLEVDSVYHHAYISEIRYNSSGRLFLIESFGIFVSDDNGDHYQLISPDIGSIDKLNFAPSGDVYAVGWGGILRSTNGGSVWDTLYDPVNSQFFSDIDFGLDGEIYAVGGNFGEGNGFYRSLDNGLTWEAIGFPDDFRRSLRVNSEGNILVGGFGYNGMYQSTDQGSTWTFCSSIIADVMESFNDDQLIAGRCVNGYRGCWYSSDWGQSWVTLTDDQFNPRVDQISVSPSGYAYIKADTSGSLDYKLFRSVNPLVGINSVEKNAGFVLYPNPMKDQLFISGNQIKKIDKIAIYSLTGQKMAVSKYQTNPILFPEIIPGIYIIEIQSGSGVFRKKIIHY